MFAKGDFVFYASGGICRVEDIQRAPLPGMPEDRTYYILRSLHDANGISYLPTDCTTVFLRPILTAEEAERFLNEASGVETIEAPDAKILRSNYQEAMRKYQPGEWFRVIKTVRERAARIGENSKPIKLSETERTFGEEAKKFLYTELSLALRLTEAQIEECLFESGNQKAE
ncbi:MAG: hypothetical protein E7680_06150 [Ruminococcaceae bacterium]|nr:hypothetical protein [Oscillospiraceae bacterium]